MLSAGNRRDVESGRRGVDEKESDAFKDGIMMNSDFPEVYGHAVNGNRTDQLEKRLVYSQYLISPTKFGFKKYVRILALVFRFISKCRKKKITSISCDERRIQFSLFHSKVFSQDSQAVNADSVNQPLIGAYCVTDEFLNMALIYIYKKTTAEVLHFYQKQKIEKIGVLKHKILFSKRNYRRRDELCSSWRT